MNKSNVQVRIESWQPSRPTLKSLQVKLLEATRRRDAFITQSVAKIQERMHRRKKSISIRMDHVNNDLLHDESLAIEEKFQAKKQKADYAQSKTREKFVSIMSEKRQKIEMIKEKRALAQDERESTLERKLSAAEIRKDILLTQVVVSKRDEHTKKIAKLNQVRNESFDKVSRLEDSSKMKLEAANERKEKVLNEIKLNALNGNKRKEERKNLLLQKLESQRLSSSKKLMQKLEHASDRKENIVNSKKVQSSNANALVASRVMELSRKRASKELDLRCRYENRILSSSKKRNTQRGAVSRRDTTVTLKKGNFEKGKLFKVAENAKLELVKERLNEKMQNAAERREMILKSKVSKARQNRTSKSLSPTSSLSENALSDARCKIMLKLEEVSARREKILLERAEQAGFRSAKRPKSDLEISTECGTGFKSWNNSSPISSCSPVNLDFKLFNKHENLELETKKSDIKPFFFDLVFVMWNWLFSRICSWLK